MRGEGGGEWDRKGEGREGGARQELMRERKVGFFWPFKGGVG